MTRMSTPKMTRPNIRILIVDDMAQVRQDLRTVLMLAGNKAGIPVEIVGEAEDGKTAILQVEALQPEIVLMDLAMPILDGFEATQQIKKSHPACRVIALTIHSYETARLRAIQAGVDDFIEKGTPVSVLIETIAKQWCGIQGGVYPTLSE